MENDPKPPVTSLKSEASAAASEFPPAPPPSPSAPATHFKKAYYDQKQAITLDLKAFQAHYFDTPWQTDLFTKFQAYLHAALDLYQQDVSSPGVKPTHWDTIAPWFLAETDSKESFFPAKEATPKEQLKILPAAFHTFQQTVEQAMRPTLIRSAVRSVTQTLLTVVSAATAGYVSLPEGSSWLNIFASDFITLGSLLDVALQKEDAHLQTLKEETTRIKTQLSERKATLRALSLQLQQAEPATSTDDLADSICPPLLSTLEEEIAALKIREQELVVTLGQDQELLKAAQRRMESDQAQKAKLQSLLARRQSPLSSISSYSYWPSSNPARSADEDPDEDLATVATARHGGHRRPHRRGQQPY